MHYCVRKKPDCANLLNYDNGDYSQGFGQIKEAFRALTKVDNLECYVSDHDFKSSNKGIVIGYN